MIAAVSAAREPESSEPRLDRVAFLEGNADRIARLAAGFLNDPGDVEDAVQDTLEAAYRGWATVRDENARQAWLSTICVRRCLRVRRWRLRHTTVPLLNEVSASDPSRDVDWDRAFTRLTAAQRVVIVLHYHHGYTLDECATLMGRHPGTIRQHLSRGLKHLREELTHD